MAKLDLGDGRQVEVDDSFKALPPAQQEAVVAHIRQSIGPAKTLPEGTKLAPTQPNTTQGMVGVDPVDFGKTALSLPGVALRSTISAPGDIYTMATGNKTDLNSEGIERKSAELFGEPYKAQHPVTQAAQQAASMAPAMLGGPETMALRPLTRIAAPLGADLLTRQATEDPYVRMGAQMLTPGLVRGAISPTRIKATPEAVNARANAEFVNQELKPYGGRLSAGDTTAAALPMWLDKYLGKPSKGSDAAIQRAATQALLKEQGVGGTSGLAPHAAGGAPATRIPDYLTANVSPVLDKYGHLPKDDAGNAARAAALSPVDAAEYAAAQRKWAQSMALQESLDEKGLVRPDKLYEASKDYPGTYPNRLSGAIAERTAQTPTSYWTRALTGTGGALAGGALGQAGAAMLSEDGGANNSLTGLGHAGGGSLGFLAGAAFPKALRHTPVRWVNTNPVTQSVLRQQRLDAIPLWEKALRGAGNVTGYSGDARMNSD